MFEYWTHALAYVPTRDIRFALAEMKAWKVPSWYGGVTRAEVTRLLKRIEAEGPITIRDIDDDVLVEKQHPWASRKPSKRALQVAFYRGQLAVRERQGMLKSYDLFDRHFGWEERPKPATERETLAHLLDRALGAQGAVTPASVCHLDAPRKPGIRALLERRVAKGAMVEVEIEGVAHWMRADAEIPPPSPPLVHVLSPFDPLMIQRKRAALFFGYEHRFEAYVPKDKRVYGYFALPVLLGDRVVAVLDLKTDRAEGKLRIQQWTWVPKQRSREAKLLLEEELGRFEAFQLAR